jgi:hypothetical protein
MMRIILHDDDIVNKSQQSVKIKKPPVENASSIYCLMTTKLSEYNVDFDSHSYESYHSKLQLSDILVKRMIIAEPHIIPGKSWLRCIEPLLEEHRE